MSEDGNRLLEMTRPDREFASDQLMLENSGCWAKRDEESIRVYDKEGHELYGMSTKIIPFESKPIFLTLQTYLMGYNTGRAVGKEETKNKINELIKLCL